MSSVVRSIQPTIGISVAIAVGGLITAFVLLAMAGQIPLDSSLLKEIGKLFAQFIVIVILGSLATRGFDRLTERQAELRAAQERKENHVRRLIDLTHDIDLARLLILANRSVKTWSDQMTDRIIPAYIELRDLQHDHKSANAAGQPIFDRGATIRNVLGEMVYWLKSLCQEFADDKKNLSKLQVQARDDPIKQDELWRKLLPVLGDFLEEESTQYGRFRDSYRQALTIMRSELSATTIPMSGRSCHIEPVVMELHVASNQVDSADENIEVHCFLVQHQDGVVLIDTGVLPEGGESTNRDLIFEALKRMSCSWRDVTDVVLTHEHVDHVGGLNQVAAKAPQAAIWAGEEDISSIRSETNFQGNIVGLADGDFVRDLRVLRTPGHTLGHLSLVHDSASVLFTGDAVDTATGHIARPPDAYTADKQMAEGSLRRLASVDVDRVLFSHGGEIRNPQQALRSLIGGSGTSTNAERQGQVGFRNFINYRLRCLLAAGGNRPYRIKHTNHP